MMIGFALSTAIAAVLLGYVLWCWRKDVRHRRLYHEMARYHYEHGCWPPAERLPELERRAKERRS